MAVKTEGEKTAMLRAGKPAAPMNIGVSAGKQSERPPVTRKKA
jgi:hypothetical protein